ncbi:MAG: DUF1284 domain-containing protein [Bacteroidota bacterium]
MISLRGHHLICLQTFAGRGYDRDFVTNMEEIVRSLRARPDQEVRLLAGCDSVCSCCPSKSGGLCRSGGELAEARVSRKDRLVLGMIGVSPGAVLPFALVDARIRHVLRQDPELKQVCGGCEWWDICRARVAT